MRGPYHETILPSIGWMRPVRAAAQSSPASSRGRSEPGSGADTYIGLLRTNATLIAEALA